MANYNNEHNNLFDLLIIGGGINGVGIACDAAGRGLRVLLCEKNDLASGTSSRSTKLIHGGLRYLEHFEFRLVREALIEREVMLSKAPHFIWPMQFVMPLSPAHRPAWMISLGLWIYDHLGGRKRLSASKRLSLIDSPFGAPLQSQFKRGFSYADCWVDDSRLVVLNAMAASEKGAEILTHTPFVSAIRHTDHFEATLKNPDNSERIVRAKVLINAAGPWVSEILKEKVKIPSHSTMQLVKGSHIVVKKLFEGDNAYILQNKDNRIIFVIPFENDFSLIGTTDVSYEGDPADLNISDDEIQYLTDCVNQYFDTKIRKKDVIWSYSGVRPLYGEEADNPSAISRDYHLDLNVEGAPLLSIFGGKITTYRKLSEHALNLITPYFKGISGAWTERAPLPGGDISDADFDTFFKENLQEFSWLPPRLCLRYCHQFGTRINDVLLDCHCLEDLGKKFGDELYEREINYLITKEFAQSDEDILWRRTKLGLKFSDLEVLELKSWLQQTVK